VIGVNESDLMEFSHHNPGNSIINQSNFLDQSYRYDQLNSSNKQRSPVKQMMMSSTRHEKQAINDKLFETIEKITNAQD